MAIDVSSKRVNVRSEYGIEPNARAGPFCRGVWVAHVHRPAHHTRDGGRENYAGRHSAGVEDAEVPGLDRSALHSLETAFSHAITRVNNACLGSAAFA